MDPQGTGFISRRQVFASCEDDLRTEQGSKIGYDAGAKLWVIQVRREDIYILTEVKNCVTCPRDNWWS